MLPDIAAQLTKVLKNELPGFEAHAEMMPYKRITALEARETLNPRHSAVMILLFPVENDPHILLIQRTEYDGTHSGQIAFPGGKMDPDDKDLLDTALRETWEEIGVASNKITVLGELSEVYIPPSNFLAKPYIGWIDRFPILSIQENEVQQVLTIPVKDLFLPENRKRKSMVLPTYNITLEVPYFDLKGHTVWGATALMLNEFRWIFERLPI